MNRIRVMLGPAWHAVARGRGRRYGWIAAVAVAAVVGLALVTGLSGVARRPDVVRLSHAAASSSPAVAPGAASSPPAGAPVPGSEGAATQSHPTTAGTTSGSGPYAARLPHFPPAPVPVPVTVPAGPAAGWYTHIATTQPVAFLTIDDGWTKRPEARQLLAEAHVPVTLFLTLDAIHDNTDYFRQLQSPNVVIEAHTITHPSLKGKSYATQRHEICGSADQLGRWYGRRPVLFRPPFGEKDATTLRAVRDCGMKAAFYWTETVDKGKVRYQRGHSIRAGDIILMHFRPAFVDDFIAALTAISKAGLTPALLGDYVR